MPYVESGYREYYRKSLSDFPAIASAGELSYVITHFIKRYVGPTPRYISLALVVGVLILTTLEFVRRVVNPYEDIKIQENGDVYYVTGYGEVYGKANYEIKDGEVVPTQPGS